MKNTAKGNNSTKHYLKVNVPSHWEVVLLEEVLEKIIGGGTPSKSNPEYWAGKIPWLTVKDMRTTRPNDAIDHISEDAIIESATNLIPADTVIIATRIGLGKVIRVPFDAAINQDLKALVNHRGIEKSYLELWLLSISNYLQSIGSGTTVKGIRLEQLKSLPFPLAPQEEQKRIVEEIEKQFSRLDEAVENLQRVKANLKHYKASVLKAAVEGKLTEEWRNQNPDIESASKLLERILTERRTKWEKAELTKMKAKGKVPKDYKWKKKYKEPKAPEDLSLPPIPKNWAWATLPQLGELNRGKSKHRPRNDPKLYGGPYPFIQTGDVRHASGYIIEYSQTYSEKGLEQSRLWPVDTLCITIAANIADTAILSFEACFPDSIVGFISETEYIDIRYVEYFLRTAKRDLDRFAPATAQKNINLAILSEVAIPVMSVEEQNVIIQEVERRFSIVERLDKCVESNLRRYEKLKQSIFNKAFSGELVESSPDDEPVKKLLERIKDQKKISVAPISKVKRGRRVMMKKDSYLMLEEVGDKYLARLLSKNGKEMDSAKLWQLSELKIDDFYLQLKREVEEGLIVEGQGKKLLKLANEN